MRPQDVFHTHDHFVGPVVPLAVGVQEQYMLLFVCGRGAASDLPGHTRQTIRIKKDVAQADMTVFILATQYLDLTACLSLGQDRG